MRPTDTILAALLLHASGCLCVGQGTLVQVPDGVRPVEELTLGSPVTSVDDDGTRRISAVMHIVSGTRQTLEVILADGKTLRLTPAHAVHAGGRWTTARRLRPGDLVTTESGRSPVRSTRRRAGRIPVFGLTLAPADNLFANGILIHNKGPPKPYSTLADLASGPWEGFSDEPDQDRLAIRLEIRPDGTGRAATLAIPPDDGAPDSPELWRVERVTIDDHDLTIQMTRERDQHRWELRGVAMIAAYPLDPVVALCIHEPGARRACRSIYLHAPRNLSGRLQQLRSALHPGPAGPPQQLLDR